MGDRRHSRAVIATLAVVAIAALGMVIAHFQRLPTGPVPVAWDHEPCAHCRMLVSEPRFAAQLQTRDGRVLDFDDPGCLIAYESAHHPDEHAVYFHELRGDRWLSRDRTAFVPAEGTPMGYGLGAAEVGTPGAISYDEARARVLSREASSTARAPGATP